MSKKIMIVDDEADILEYLMAALEDSGYITCTAKDINNILDSISSEKPDLIILDIMMPNRSGLSIYKEIQLTPEFKKIPVILISGLSSKNEFQEELFKGKKDSDQIACSYTFVEKPVQLEKLKNKITDLLKQRLSMISTAYLNICIKENLFDIVPMTIAVIDDKFNLVYANKMFKQVFGSWKNKKCHEVYKNLDSLCSDCKGSQAFKDGRARQNQEVGYDKNGVLTRYIKHTIPVADENNKIVFLIEMSIDITQTEKIKKEHQLLFDQVPCSILVIDKNFKIIRTNQQFKNMFEPDKGKPCYQSLKGLDSQCSDCTAKASFEDGKMHTGQHMWKTAKGDEIHFQITTVPLESENGEPEFVMEMAVDITKTRNLQKDLKIAHHFQSTMISESLDGIVAVDPDRKITILNSAASKIFDMPVIFNFSDIDLDTIFPKGFLDQVEAGPGQVYLQETQIKKYDGSMHPVRLTGLKLIVEDKLMGMAFTIQDLMEIKQLEDEKLEAERLAAVGQTVAGLAHGVKNLITSLEGGMYLLSSGMKKSNIDRIGKGMEILDRNVFRVATFVKEFLNFSKGRSISVSKCSPEKIVEEVVMSCETEAAQLKISLENKTVSEIIPAPMDYENILECLTNLVGNAIDACQMSDNKGSCFVHVKVYEANNVIVFKVTDNGCGMDYEVKSKVFTNFFTTKGTGGTGLGLLTTKKIIQEHGGTIQLQSEPGQGSTFKILLPRKRLPKIAITA